MLPGFFGIEQVIFIANKWPDNPDIAEDFVVQGRIFLRVRVELFIGF